MVFLPPKYIPPPKNVTLSQPRYFGNDRKVFVVYINKIHHSTAINV